MYAIRSYYELYPLGDGLDFPKCWARRENAARILQAFFAWGNLEEIENLINKAQEAVKPENMIPVFKRMWITVNKEMITQKEDDGSYNFV